MSDIEFQASIEEAKRLEKKIIEYKAYEGDMSIEATMDLEPEEMLNVNYNDLINEYGRTQKIIKTRKMDIFAEGAKEKTEVTAESAEVETKLREMTSQTLENAEAVAEEKEIETPAPEIELERIEIEKPEIEFETEPVKREQEIEKPPKPEIEFEHLEEKPEIEIEKPRIEEEKPEIEIAPEEPHIEEPKKEKITARAVPPALAEAADQAADRKYQKIEEQIRATLGEQADELAMKKKMLELTKQLFKEKSFNARAEIKLQITALKNMLVGAKEGKRPKGAKKEEPYGKMLETIVSTQQAENAQAKDKVIESYKERIKEIKEKFYEDISLTTDREERKRKYDDFVFSVTSLVEELPEIVKKYEGFAKKKHLAELEKLKASAKDKKVLKMVEDRISFIEESYEKDFKTIKRIIAQNIDSLIDVTGTEVLRKPEEKEEDVEAKAHEIVKEINETDEGSLLYFLHSKDSDYYRMYERKQISKAEAISRAKILMAKDKGLGQSAIKKYFSEVEE